MERTNTRSTAVTNMINMKLLKELCSIHAPSGEEYNMTEFLLKHIAREKKRWKVQPEIYHGDEFQDCIILKFGAPRTAIFAHMDTVGFTVRYGNQLLPIGSPDAEALIEMKKHIRLQSTLITCRCPRSMASRWC